MRKPVYNVIGTWDPRKKKGTVNTPQGLATVTGAALTPKDRLGKNLVGATIKILDLGTWDKEIPGKPHHRVIKAKIISYSNERTKKRRI